jgi:hypothetical protein
VTITPLECAGATISGHSDVITWANLDESGERRARRGAEPHSGFFDCSRV